jgi:hypothetical protein
MDLGETGRWNWVRKVYLVQVVLNFGSATRTLISKLVPREMDEAATELCGFYIPGVQTLGYGCRLLMSKMDLRETGYEDRGRMDPTQNSVKQWALLVAEWDP